MLVVNLAAAAVTAVLALSSGRNVAQTINVGRQDPRQSSIGDLFQPTDSTEAVVSKVQGLKRKELLELYFSSRGPTDLSELQGEWDGCLLDNQSWIMVGTSEECGLVLFCFDILISLAFLCIQRPQ